MKRIMSAIFMLFAIAGYMLLSLKYKALVAYQISTMDMDINPHEHGRYRYVPCGRYCIDRLSPDSVTDKDLKNMPGEGWA